MGLKYFLLVQLRSSAIAKVLATPNVITGVVQSRINLAKGATRFTPLTDKGKAYEAGFEHVVTKHINGSLTGSNSVFTVGQEELKIILQSKNVVQAPVREVTGQPGVFVRIVDTGKIIGTSTLNTGGQATTWIKVFTDRAGNLMTTFPIAKPQ